MSIRITEWRGPAVLRAVEKAVARAIDDTTEDAARLAEASAPRRTGQLQSEIVSERAVVKAGRITGRFGATKRRGFYGLFHERRRPFLRPAADVAFPRLRGRVTL